MLIQTIIELEYYSSRAAIAFLLSTQGPKGPTYIYIYI